MTGTLLEDRYTVVIISRSVFLRMRNVSEKFVEKIKTQYFMFDKIKTHIFYFR
jgi:hypothetical protein